VLQGETCWERCEDPAESVLGDALHADPEWSTVNGEPSVRLGIVGGAGQMGSWLRRFWASRGFPVLISDRGTPLSNQDVAAQVDLLFVAVPLHLTPAVLVELGPVVRADAAVISLASLMEPSAAALRTARGDALCLHPVFGPTVIQVTGLPVVIAPIHGSTWAEWLAVQLRAAGLVVQFSTPGEHDRHMAYIQALLHSLFVALAATFEGAELPPGDALSFASPTLRLQLGLMARILSQDPALYADLVVGNPAAPLALDALAAQLQRLADCARRGDREGFITAFTGAREGFGAALPGLAAEAERALARHD
jgi:prephenate dehydrogenase